MIVVRPPIHRRPRPVAFDIACWWDRDEAAHRSTIADWLAANPDDPDHATMRGILDRDRDSYLRWGRRYLGGGVFVTRPR